MTTPKRANVSDFWTDELVARAVELFNKGWSCGTIAREIGGTRNAVLGKLTRMGHTRTKGEKATVTVERPRVTIRPVNSNSNAMRVCEDVDPISVKLREIEVDSKLVSLFDLDDNGCRYPIGDPVLFCGNPKITGFSYCGPHANLCCRPARPRTDSYVAFRKIQR